MIKLVTRALFTLTLLLSWAPASAAVDAGGGPAPGVDAGGKSTGLVILQVDGLSEPALRLALESGAMPFVQSLVDGGSHSLGSWRTTAATSTPVTQGSLLHGNWRHIPAFRWWDRQTGQLLDFLDREQARVFAEGLEGPHDLLTDGGASITNLFAGGAPRVVLTATRLDGAALAWELLRYVADLPKDVHVVAGFTDGVVAGLMRVIRGESAPLALGEIGRKAPVPVVGPALEWALVDVTAAAVLRELQRGTPLMYATFTTYDEVGHYAGPAHPAALDALGHIDNSLRLIHAAAERADLPYHLVILSDHGQTDGQPFAVRYGETLDQVVRGLVSDPGAELAEAVLPELVVAASGNLAHVYFPGDGQRLDAAELEALHPGLIDGLAAHPGIGIVGLQAADGYQARGADGSRDLVTGAVSGTDPLAPYGPLAAISMANIMAPANAGDLVVVSTYDPVTEETFSFEPQLGSHGGIGGAQMEPFVLYPSHMEPSGQPLHLTGPDELRAAIDRWLANAEAEPAPANIGDEVCVSSVVEGAVGEVCARRDRFGALWTAELTDTADDGHAVEARLSLDVAEARDETASVVNDEGEGVTVRSSDRFAPRVGTALRDVSLEVCVILRFRPDRCQTESAPLPPLTPQATPSQLQRLEELAFELPLQDFIAERARATHSGVDADFDWSSDGCSAGPLRELFDERLEAACLRHDFAYRNFGQLFLDPTDDVRLRVDDRLAADAEDLGQGTLAGSLRDTLRRFGAPVFFGDDLAALWDVPDFIVSRFGPDTEETPSD